MNRRTFLAGLPLLAASAADPARPNIVFILADDLGYGTSAATATAGRIPTPNLDALAARHALHRRPHPSAVCTPTRYGL